VRYKITLLAVLAFATFFVTRAALHAQPPDQVLYGSQSFPYAGNDTTGEVACTYVLNGNTLEVTGEAITYTAHPVDHDVTVRFHYTNISTGAKSAEKVFTLTALGNTELHSLHGVWFYNIPPGTYQLVMRVEAEEFLNSITNVVPENARYPYALKGRSTVFTVN